MASLMAFTAGVFIGIGIVILLTTADPMGPLKPRLLEDCAWTLTPLDNGNSKLEGVCK